MAAVVTICTPANQPRESTSSPFGYLAQKSQKTMSSSPAASSALPPATVKPLMNPHGCPPNSSTSTERKAIITAPRISDIRRAPAVGADGGGEGSSIVAAATAPAISTIASAPPSPHCWVKENASNAGKSFQNSICAAASTAPATKPRMDSSATPLPPPAPTMEPEVHAPPSCMPMPKMNAPTITDIASGRMFAAACAGSTSPAPVSSANGRAASATQSICARSPVPSPRTISARQVLAKPNWQR